MKYLFLVVGVILGSLIMPTILEGIVRLARFIGEPDYFRIEKNPGKP